MFNKSVQLVVSDSEMLLIQYRCTQNLCRINALITDPVVFVCFVVDSRCLSRSEYLLMHLSDTCMKDVTLHANIGT